MPLTNYTIASPTGGTWTIQSTNSAQVGRYHDMSLLMEGVSGNSQLTQSRPGVLTAGSLDNTSQLPTAFRCITANTALNVFIYRGAAVVERGTLAGSYLVQSTAAGAVTLATADATNSRIDRVDLQVFDGALGDNGGTSLTRLVVTTGVASGSPVLPGAPTNSIPLCQILLPANATVLTAGMFTDTRKSSGLRGGVRVLLPGDALADAGFMVGELRDTTAIQTPGWIDRWDTIAAIWRHVSPTNGTGDTLLAGQYKNSTPVSTSGTTELALMSTGALSLEANSVYKITFQSVGGMNSSIVERWAQRIRKTNVGGAQITVSVIAPATNASQPIGQMLSYPYVTTTTETTTFVGTIARLTSNSAGNTWTVAAPDTFITCEYVGPSSFFTTA
jgi:hypothetical protein